MTTIVRRSRLDITCNGLPLDVPVLSCRISEGFIQAVSQAEFVVPYLTARLALNTPLFIQLDADEIGQPAHIQTHFMGYVVGYGMSLYPRGVSVRCEGPLSLAAAFKPDVDQDFVGFTDILAIRLALVTSGIPITRMQINGTSTLLGQNAADPEDRRFQWSKGQSALEFIQSIDEISEGYRTFEANGSGFIRRTRITSIPTINPTATFTEGVDITLGSSDWQLEEGAVGVEVIGANGPAGNQIIAGQTRTGLGNGFITVVSPMIETDAQAQAIADWAAANRGRPVVRLTLTTYRRDTVRSGQTVQVNGLSRLGLSRRVWVQQNIRELAADGAVSQTLEVLSEIIPDPTILEDHLPGDDSGFGGDEQPTPAGPDTASFPDLLDPLADFQFEMIDHEFTDAGTEFWIVIARATSSPMAGGTLDTYAWATDTATIPETGDSELFTFKTTDIATELTLTVTDSQGNPASITKACNSPEALEVTRDRHLYAASGGADAIAYDGAGNWNTQAVAGGGPVDVVANGPVWSDGGDAAISSDDLATAPAASAVFPDQSVSSIWTETDINASQVYAGGDAGGVARSTDGGSSWTILTSASSEAVLRIIASRFNPGEVLMLDALGDVYQSLNGGASWGHIVSHPGAVDLAQSNFRNWVCGPFGVAVMENPSAVGLIESEGPPEPLPNIIAISAHIKDDVLYALADDGFTYYTSPAGGMLFVAGASLPSGTAQVRGMMRDGAGVDLIYIAAGDRILKSHDGLRTADGYSTIYTGAAVMVGYGDFPLAFTPPSPPGGAGQLFSMAYETGAGTASIAGLVDIP